MILVIVNIVGIGASREVQFWRRLEFKRLLAQKAVRRLAVIVEEKYWTKFVETSPGI